MTNLNFCCLEECSLALCETLLVSELYPIIKQVVGDFTETRRKYDGWPSYDTGYTDTRTISNYKEKIDRIVTLLDSSHNKQEKFLINFALWKEQRKQNIKKLRKIAESLKGVRMVSNVVKITAGGVGLVGGAAIIGSLLFPPASPNLIPGLLGGETLSALLPSIFLPATPVVSSLAIAGGVAAAGAAVGNIGASIAELVLNQKRLDEANEVIVTDQKQLEQLGVFEFFDELNDAIDDLFSTSNSSRILEDLIDFLNKVPPILDLTEPLQQGLYLCLRLILPNLTKFLVIGISLASVVLSIFFAVFLVRRRGCAILNHHLALGLVRAVNASVGIARLIAAATLKYSKLGELIPRDLTGKIAVGAIACAGIALDIESIFISFVDLSEGSISGEVSMISEVAYKLKSQLKSYRNVNNELQKRVSHKVK